MKKFIIFSIILVFYTSNIYAQECSRPVVFPLISKPVNDDGMEYGNYNWRSDLGENQAVYKSYRIRENKSENLIKKSFHASRDLYTDVYNDTGK